MKLLVFVISAILLISCNSSKDKVVNEDIPFDSIAHGFFCSIDVKKQVVLQKDSEYQKLWDEVYMNLDQMPRIPDVDLNKFTVIAVFMGIKNTGGYDIKIEKIKSKGDKLLVNVTESSPGTNCMVTDAISKPYEFVKIKKTDKEIEFNINYITKDCQ